MVKLTGFFLLSNINIIFIDIIIKAIIQLDLKINKSADLTNNINISEKSISLEAYDYLWVF